MKQTIITLICCLPCLTLGIGAIFLAYKNIEGWEWFLLVACLLTPDTILKGE